MRSDVRHALRSLLRSPAFSIAAIVTIALGIGVNTAVFSVVHTVLLDTLPFRQPDRLIHISTTHPSFPATQTSAPDFADWQRMSTSFEGMAAYTFQAINKSTILSDGEPESVQVVQASHSLFAMLGVQPLLGRAYSAAEERDKAPVVLMSEALWRRRYGADPAMAGRQIRLVNMSVTVIGVVGGRSAQPGWADIWMPMSFLDPALVNSRRFRALEVLGRLKPGVTLEQALPEMSGIATALARQFPDTNGNIGTSLLPLDLWISGETRPPLLLAWAAVSLVLLLACANVAHLMLVRTAHRSRELAVRAALGAGASRIIRFLLVENAVVALLGGSLGLVLAFVMLPLLLQMATSEIPRAAFASLSPTALAFGGAAGVLCAAVFALPSLLRSRGVDLYAAIKQSSGPSLSARRSWFGASIIAAEVALAFLVITSAGLLSRSFASLLEQETGFDAKNVLALHVPLASTWGEAATVFEQRVAPALRAIPGVTQVAGVNTAPLTLRPSEVTRFATRFGVQGRTFTPGSFPVAQLRWITPDYFDILRIRFTRGRLFMQADVGKPGYIINEALARRFFPNTDPVGRNLLIDVMTSNPVAVPIIGVVADVRDLSLDREPAPTLYTLAVSNAMTLLLRTETSPESLVGPVRTALRAALPDAPFTVLGPLEGVVGKSLAFRRFALQLFLAFGFLAAALTIAGVYGVVSYALSQRTHEFAIRFALGAETRDVYSVIFRDFGLPALAGLMTGAWCAYLSAQALRGLLYRLSPTDPAVLAASAAGILLLVVLAGWGPASKAAAISPSRILRQ